MGGFRIGDNPSDGGGEGEAAVALIEWSQLKDEEKGRVRAEAQRLMAEMFKKQEAHEKIVTAARKRLEHTTTEAGFGQGHAPSGRASFECRVAIRLQEEHHAKEIEALEAQVSPYSHKA